MVDEKGKGSPKKKIAVGEGLTKKSQWVKGLKEISCRRQKGRGKFLYWGKGFLAVRTWMCKKNIAVENGQRNTCSGNKGF